MSDASINIRSSLVFMTSLYPNCQISKRSMNLFTFFISYLFPEHFSRCKERRNFMTIQPGAQLYTLGFGNRPENVEVPFISNRAPSSMDTNFPIGKRWIDTVGQNEWILVGLSSVGGVLSAIWSQGGNEAATTSSPGIVTLSTLAQLESGTAPAGAVVPLANDVFTFVNSVVIAGGNLATEAAVGLIQEATDAQAVAGTNLNPGTPLAVQPKNLAPVFASPPALGGTAPNTGSFTTLATSGLSSLSGSATILSGGTAINIGSDASADAINIGTGAAARTITIGNSTGATAISLNNGTGALNLGTNAIAHTVTIGNVTGATAVNINTGTGGSTITTTNGTFAVATGTGAINIGADAAAHTITIGNITGATAVNINTGTGGSTYTTTNGTLSFVTGTGGINIGADAAAKTITIGNSTGATSVVLNSGTGAINIGTNAVAHTVTIGNVTGATAVNINTGTGGSTYTTTNGAFALNTGTGAIGIGTDAAAKTITIGNVTGATAVVINAGTGASSINTTNGAFSIVTGTGAINVGADAAATTVNVATGGAVKTLTLGSTNGASISTLQSGSGGISVAATNGALTVTSGTGALNISNDAAATTVNVGTGAAAKAVTIGSTNTTSATTINAGSGLISLGATTKLTASATQFQQKGGAATDFIGSGVLVLGTVTINNTNIAATDRIFLSRTAANASTTLGELSYTISAGASFTVTSLILGTPGSTQTGDVSSFVYWIIRQI